MRIVSIFIPAYNAEKTIRGVIERIPASLWSSIGNIYLINDGSSDRTSKINADLALNYNQCVPLNQPNNLGYGATVKNGLRHCRADRCEYAVCLHADGQYPPESIVDGIHKMQTFKIDLLQGSRIASGTALSGGMPRYKYYCGRLLTRIENRVFKLSLSDYHSGFLIYHRCILDAIIPDRFSNSFDFDLEMIACARASRFSIGEIPIPTRYADETSYLHPISYGFRVLRVLFRYLKGTYKGNVLPIGENSPDVS